jgi:hypothetical protein
VQGIDDRLGQLSLLIAGVRMLVGDRAHDLRPCGQICHC